MFDVLDLIQKISPARRPPKNWGQTPPEIPWGGIRPPRPHLKWLRQGVPLANFDFSKKDVFVKCQALGNRVCGVSDPQEPS